MLIPRQALSAVLCASKEALRYAINGVLVERDADGVAHCVATDGHRLAVVTWPEPDPADYPPLDGVDPASRNPDGFSTILSSMHVHMLLKAIPKSRNKPILEYVALDEAASSPNGVLCTVTDLESVQTWNLQPLTGSFPPWCDVVPVPRSGLATIRIDARSLADACALAHKFPDETGKAIVDLTIDPTADGPSQRPMRIDIAGEAGELLYVIMPCTPK